MDASAHPSLFRRIARYPRGETNPRENRLTEALAVVLERVPGLAAALVEEWTDVSVEERLPMVTTQRATHQGYFIDMELRFGDLRARPDAVIWIECKLCAPPVREQLDRYAADLRYIGARESALVLLAPAPAIASADLEPHKARAWQGVDRWLRDRLDPSAPARIDEDGRWLVGELVTYLKEEGVAEEALSVEHTQALRHRRSADRLVSEIMRAAEEFVDREWGDRGQRGGSPYQLGYWRHFGTAARHEEPPTWEGWFEWSFKQADDLTERPEELVWAAGATFPSDRDPVGVPGNEAWHARREDDGFRHLKYDGWWRLFRCLGPDELLSEGSVELQGRVLGEWIVRAFRDLAADPPPNLRDSSR